MRYDIKCFSGTNLFLKNTAVVTIKADSNYWLIGGSNYMDHDMHTLSTNSF